MEENYEYMTDSEAIEILKRDLQIQIENKALPDGIEAIKIAIQALEKQIPKKPILANHMMPTAYSVDKVVDELEEVKMRYFLTIANTGDEKSDFAYENVGNALDDAIEIVKQQNAILKLK